jgi:predicted HAD superfamily hydrolase
VIRSYDVFDTCLIRTCGLPAGVFHLLAERLLGADAGETLRAELVNLRMRAEAAARAAFPREITLDEIYQRIDLLPFPGLTPGAMKAAELEIEREVLRPVAGLRERIARQRAGGHRILFISDMYLPSAFVRERLADAGFFHEGDRLYISSSVGCTKHDGGLYRHVREREDASFSDWEHYGDHPGSDVNVPRALGIRARLCRETAWTRDEQRWMEDACCFAEPAIGYLLAGVARAARLSAPGSGTLRRMVANVVAPLFAPFVFWVLQDAAGRGVRRLYFMARDGYVMHQIAQRFAARFPQVECRYLHGSRRSLYLSGLQTGAREEMRWLFTGFERKTPRQMLLRLGLTGEILEPARRDGRFETTFLDAPLDAASYQVLLDALAHPEVNRSLLEKAGEARRSVAAYLRQEQVLDAGAEVALVDLGWTRNCQFAIERIRNACGCSAPLFGYYFAVFWHRRYPSGTTPFDALLMPELQEWKGGAMELEKSAALLEQVFALAPHGSTLDYREENGRMVPVLAETENPRQVTAAFVEQMHETLFAFAGEYARMPALMRSAAHVARGAGWRTFHRMWKEPAMDEARLIGELLAGNNVGDNQRIAPRLSPVMLFKLLLGGEGGLASWTFWPAGSMVRTLGPLGRPLLRLRQALRKVRRPTWR